MSREIGSTLKPIFVDANGDAKACDLPKSATQLGTNSDGEIIAVSIATSGSTTNCYISPDAQYWKSKAQVTEIQTETITDRFLKDQAIAHFVTIDSKKYYVGDDSNFDKQLTAEDTNRKYFPVFTLTRASEFINKFRISTRGQNFQIVCEKGVYLYAGRQEISHPDVQGGGASSIIILGSADSDWHNGSGINKPFTFGEAELSPVGAEEDKASIEYGNGRNVPYEVTFMTPIKVNYSGFARVNGIVQFQKCNLTFGGYDETAREKNGVCYGDYYADTITYENYAGKMQSQFIVTGYDDGTTIDFASVWINTGLYACYNCSNVNIKSVNILGKGAHGTRSVATVHTYVYPVQVNSSMVTPMFGAFGRIAVSTSTYLRVIANHTRDSSFSSKAFYGIFQLETGCKFAIGRDRLSPIRIDVDSKNFYLDHKDSSNKTVIDGCAMLIFINTHANTGILFDVNLVNKNNLIAQNEDAVAIYWHATCDDAEGHATQRKIASQTYVAWDTTDCIPLFRISDSIKADYAVWSIDGTNFNNFYNDGKYLYNRFFHFKKWLNNSNTIIDLSGDFTKPNIVNTSDTNVIDGKFYYVLEGGNWRLAVDSDFNLNSSNKRVSFKTGVTYGEANNESNVGRRIENDNVEGGGHFDGPLFVHKATNNF